MAFENFKAKQAELQEKITNLRVMKRKAEEKAERADAEIEAMMGKEFDRAALLKQHKTREEAEKEVRALDEMIRRIEAENARILAPHLPELDEEYAKLAAEYREKMDDQIAKIYEAKLRYMAEIARFGELSREAHALHNEWLHLRAQAGRTEKKFAVFPRFEVTNEAVRGVMGPGLSDQEVRLLLDGQKPAPLRLWEKSGEVVRDRNEALQKLRGMEDAK